MSDWGWDGGRTAGEPGANKFQSDGIQQTNEGSSEAPREVVALITIKLVYYANKLMNFGNR